MSRLSVILAAAVSVAASLVLAQTTNPDKLSDVKALGGEQLSVDALRALLPGAKVSSTTRQGSTRFWSNDADGKFVASSDGRGSGKMPGRASGSWHIADNGTYCVTIEWRQVNTEQWCRYLFRVGDKYYGVRDLGDDAANVYPYEISK